MFEGDASKIPGREEGRREPRSVNGTILWHVLRLVRYAQYVAILLETRWADL